jgi:nitroreductase
MNESELLAGLRWRYAAKSFDASRAISPAHWAALEESLRLTPSSYGLQPWKFVVVRNAQLRERLRAASYNQRQVTECSHFLVFTALRDLGDGDVDRFLDAFSAARSVPRANLDGYRNLILQDIHANRRAMLAEWTRHQCYIALGNFLTSAALLGIDTCPMEGLVPARYDEILDLGATRYRTVVACAAGYRSAEDKSAGAAKVRYPSDDLFDRRD